MKITHSVLCITYNQERFIKKAVCSLFSGNVLPDEVIIADDCSDDNTRELLLELQKEYPSIIKLIFNPKNLGLYANLNQFKDMPKGDLIHFLAGDDWFEAGMFEAMNLEVIKWNLKPKQESFIINPGYFIHKHGALHPQLNSHLKNVNFFKSLLRQDISCRMVGISWKLFSYYPHFEPELGLWADFHHVLNLAQYCKKVYLINEAYPVYRVGEGVSSKATSLELNTSFLKALMKVSVDFKSTLDKQDNKYINYYRSKLQAILDVSASKLFVFLLHFAWNLDNGAKLSELAEVMGYYLPRLKKIIKMLIN